MLCRGWAFLFLPTRHPVLNASLFMDFTAWLAIAIFIGSYALIVSERIHRTIAAMFGGMLMVITGILSQDQALSAIDFNTLGLLVGMMIIVYVLGQTGFFNYLAIKAAHLAKGNPSGSSSCWRPSPPSAPPFWTTSPPSCSRYPSCSK